MLIDCTCIDTIDRIGLRATTRTIAIYRPGSGMKECNRSALSGYFFALLLTGLWLPKAGFAQASYDIESANEAIEEVVVTGSRIRRAANENVAPTSLLSPDALAQRGHVSLSEALNDITAITPSLNQATGGGASSGAGQQFPELFGLGTGRTLSLVNGRRFVSSSVGLGDAQVDANVIPTGLIKQVDIVQAGASAVYGSDAIAGVVNYILRDDFDGLELDAQFGRSSRNDYEQEFYRLTYGYNFPDQRGNIAVNVEHATTPQLQFRDRPLSNQARILFTNPADTGPADGIPNRTNFFDVHFFNLNRNGVIYNFPAPIPRAFTLVNGSPAQFSADGSVVPYDPGTILGIPFSTGGDGFRFSELTWLRSAVKRTAANMIGHYDINDKLTLRAEALFASTEGTERPQGYWRTVLEAAPKNALIFFANNPFLTSEAVADLSAANPRFGFGAPLFLSKSFNDDILPDNRRVSATKTSRLMLSLDGAGDIGWREYYWTVSSSVARVAGDSRLYDVNNANFANAINAVSDGAGGAACAINRDADPTNDDPACAPLNPFGFNNASANARNYVSVLTGSDFRNDQINVLATLGTSLFSLPAGDVEAVVSYEHRDEEATFTPLPANQLGLVGAGANEVPTSGQYNTNEFSFEALVPIVGNEFSIPLVQKAELTASYRYVDHSIAGTEDVWSAGFRWEVTEDITLRGTRSRNFRAPTLTQLIAPKTVGFAEFGADPCDADAIDSGPNPSARRANCEAEWARNPQYGPLETFQDPAENFAFTQVTTGGNASLTNEVAQTTSYGIVYKPRFVPGLSVTIDRIEIDLRDGLSAFVQSDFAAACYDNSPQPAGLCGTFSRLRNASGGLPAGTIVEAITTTVNAGVTEYEGEYFFVNYEVPMPERFGSLSLSVEATHNSKRNTSVTGTTFTRLDNTVELPEWISRFSAYYNLGENLSIFYQINYLSESLIAPDKTIENDPNWLVDSNTRHSLSAQYSVGNVTFRAGVNNLTDKQPSFPGFAHGDILGRRYFAGITANFL